MKTTTVDSKIKWETPQIFNLSSKSIKSGRNYFPGFETTMFAAAVTPMASLCMNVGAGGPTNFTPNAAAICAGTATTCAGPGVNGAFTYTAGPFNTSFCGMTGMINSTYIYDSFGSSLCAATTVFNLKLGVNFCSVC